MYYVRSKLILISVLFFSILVLTAVVQKYPPVLYPEAATGASINPDSSLISAEKLLPNYDYFSAFNEALVNFGAPATTQSDYFGAYALTPIEDELFIGFAADRPSYNDGTTLAKFSGGQITHLASLDEQGVADMDFDPTRNEILIGGFDPAYNDGWDSGNSYNWNLESQTLRKSRGTGLDGVLHTLGQDIDTDGTYYAVSHSYDPTGTTPGAYKDPSSGFSFYGGLYKSVNAGKSWETVEKVVSHNGEYTTHLFDVISSNNNLYTLLKPYAGKLYLVTSSDGGHTWTDMFPDGDVTLSHQRFMRFQNGFLAHGIQTFGSNSYQVLIYVEGSRTVIHYLPFSMEMSPYNLIAVAGNRVFAADGSGVIWASIDLSTWHKIYNAKANGNTSGITAIAYWSNPDKLIVAQKANRQTGGAPIQDSIIYSLNLAGAIPFSPAVGVVGSTQTGNGSAYISPTELTFANLTTSNNPLTQDWDINADNTSDADTETVKHAYSKTDQGLHIIKTAVSDGSYEAVGHRAIVIVPKVLTLITVPYSSYYEYDEIPFEASVRVLTQDTGTIGYAWDFDTNGIIDSTEKNPKYAYSSAGSKTVTLTVTYQGESYKQTYPLTILQAVNLQFSLDKPTGAVPHTVTFTNNSTINGSGTAHNWVFRWDADSDGTIDGEGNTYTHIYTQQGPYDVTLYAVDTNKPDPYTFSLTKKVAVFADIFERISQPFSSEDENISSYASSFIDINNDGLLDLVIANANETKPDMSDHFVYLQNQNGFEKISDPFKASNDTHKVFRTTDVTAADFDNDGDLDIYSTGEYWLDGNRLFLNTPSTQNTISFSPAENSSLNRSAEGSRSVALADYDKDGDLDVFIARYSDYGNALFRNDGNGVYTQITTAGSPGEDDTNRYGFTAQWVDYDLDGDQDLFVVRYANFPNSLYTNNGDGTFTALTGQPLVTQAYSTTSASWGDFNNDGYPDVVISNNATPDQVFINNHGQTFTEQTDSVISTDYPTSLSSSTAVADVNNDGWLDIFITTINYNNHVPNRLYLNKGNAQFELLQNSKITTEGGGSLSSNLEDYDKDGDVDILIVKQNTAGHVYDNTNFLYKNALITTNHWLELELQGVQSNKSGVGARIDITTAGGMHLSRFTNTTNGRGDHNIPNTVHFGLGQEASIAELSIVWPSGITQTLANVQTDQILKVTEEETAPSPTPTATPTPGINEFVGITDGQIVSGTIQVSFNADPASTKSVRFRINNRTINTDNNSLYELTNISGTGFDTTKYKDGRYILSAEVTPKKGTRTMYRITFTIQNGTQNITPTPTGVPTGNYRDRLKELQERINEYLRNRR